VKLLTSDTFNQLAHCIGGEMADCRPNDKSTLYYTSDVDISLKAEGKHTQHFT